jgi:aryl-alcohol dehydrogenase-like predicted oxidoreductase
VPWCAKHKVGILAYSPMQAGLLTGAFTAERAAALPADDCARRQREVADASRRRARMWSDTNFVSH